jgi:hypothetical protein
MRSEDDARNRRFDALVAEAAPLVSAPTTTGPAWPAART